AEAAERARGRAAAEVWRFGAQASGPLRIDELARRLGAEGITSVLVEGGGEVHASLLELRYADEVILYVAPKIVGGPARSWVGGKGFGSLAAAHRFEPAGPPVRLGDDLRLVFQRAK